MTRLSIGREGNIVSSQAPDDWVERDARPGAAPIRGGRMRSTIAPRQLTVLVAALLAIAASALVLVLVFARGDDRAASTVAAPSATAARDASPTPAAPAASSLSVKLPVQGRIGMGVKGDSVTRLQRALVEVGLDPGPRDGSFGRKTQAAVIAFQNQHGLVADGVVGRKTAAALNAALVDAGR